MKTNVELRTEVYESFCTHKNICYKTACDKELTLDILMPEKKAEKVPVIVYMHGGGWNKGDRTVLGAGLKLRTVQKLLKEGFAVVAIAYSLTSDEVTFPQNIIDSKDAVRWVRKNASKYGLDAESIGVWGSSAGGHLALMVSCTGEEDFKGIDELDGYSSKVNYAVTEFAPIDIRMIAVQTPVPRMMEITKHMLGKEYDFTKLTEEDYKVMDSYYPYQYISEKSAPTLILQGTNDILVPHIHAQLLDLKLRGFGCPSEMYLLEGMPHAFMGISDDQIEYYSEKTIDFVKRYR